MRSIWARLSVDGEGSEGFVRLRHPEIRSCATYAARRISDELEAVVVEVRTDDLPSGPELLQSVGMHVQIMPLTPGRTGRSRIVLALTDPRYRDVFQTLGEDVILGLTNVADEATAVRQFLGRVARWQAFLRQHGPDGLSPERRVGLYGELMFLRSVLLPRIAEGTAVAAWRGCSGASHDFQLRWGSVEIKTSRAVTPLAFHVSNVKQLDDTGLSSLFVLFVSVDENDGGEDSLPEAVAALRNLLSGEPSVRFEDGLAEQGYLDAHQERYLNPRYTIRNKRWFEVRAGFPRLVPSQIPDGVGNVAYVVALAACSPFECSEEQAVRTILREEIIQ